METEPAMLVGSYYAEAIPRAFWAAWDWMLGQGILLTILLAFTLVVSASGFAIYRACRRQHSWADARKVVGHAIKDFGIAGLAATALALIIVFCIFFIIDAPHQLELANQQITKLKTRIAELTPKPIVPPKKYYSDKEKNELADLIVALTQAIYSKASPVSRETANLVQLWESSQRSAGLGSAPNMPILKNKIGQINNLIVDFHEIVYGAGGLFKVNSRYEDELAFIVQFTPDNRSNDPLEELSRRLGYLDGGIYTVELSETYKDTRLVERIMSDLQLARDQIIKGEDNVRVWLKQTNDRIKMIRDQL